MNNSLVLAFLGDSIYEFYIRKYLISLGIEKVEKLQSESIKYVSAKSQASYLKSMIDFNYLNEEEISVVMRARNHKSNHRPKNCDMITYKNATGLEALIGYLYYKDNVKRIEEIIDFIINSN